jgi:tetratricopeptide (TPR) repeat protein
MKKLSPVILAIAALAVIFSTTAFQCGSAELTTAKLAIQQGQYDKAEQSLLKEVQKNDKNEEAWFMLGQVRWSMKKYTEANEALARALALSDVHAKEISNYRLSFWSQSINEGVAAFNEGRTDPAKYDVAVTKFRSAIEANPDSANTYYYMGLALTGKKDYVGAETAFLDAIKRKPNYTEAQQRLGAVYLLQAEAARTAKDDAAMKAAAMKAAGVYEQLQKQEPQNADYILSLIDIYEATGQSDKALSLTRSAVEQDPANRTFQYVYGVYLLKQDQFGEAIAHLEKVGNAPDGTVDEMVKDATYNLGVANLNWGVAMKAEAEKKAEEERARTKKDVKEDPSYKEKLKASLPYLEKAGEMRPDDAQLWQNLGRLYANLNMVEKSRMAFDKADRLARGN